MNTHAAQLPGALPAASGALALDTINLTRRFGSFTALDNVTLRADPASVHALLGENGAGKSTLVQCVAGFQRAQQGSILIDGREREIASPAAARALGIGMVYQHFTLAPSMTVAENLLLAGGKMPALINWKSTRAALTAFLASTPFQIDLDACPAQLAAGQKQKVELLKQLYLRPRLLILDEPTSVLTPQEAGELLDHVRAFARSGRCTVLIITHKFAEVMDWADTVTVLRRGRVIHHGRVADTDPQRLARAMMGQTPGGAQAVADYKPNQAFAQILSAPYAINTVANHISALHGDAAPAGLLDSANTSQQPVPDDKPNRSPAPTAPAQRATHKAAGNTTPALEICGLSVSGDRGTLAVRELSLSLWPGEILGIAGVSGNGQRELFEALVGQRPRAAGQVRVSGRPYAARRGENRALKLRSLPEEPLRNACVPEMSVADNMALRDFDLPPLSAWGLLRPRQWHSRARQWVADWGIKTRSGHAPIASLSGGNVQRAVLARELAGEVRVLIAANPVFGLDFAAVAEIHSRLLALRAQGGAVLLLSEDLDELLELSDRIAVISAGRIVHHTAAAAASRNELGAHMGGGGPH